MSSERGGEVERVLVAGAEALVLAERLAAEGYEVRASESLTDLEEVVFSVAPHAVVAGVGEGDLAVREVIARLRERAAFRHLPILIIAKRELLDGPLIGVFSELTEGLLSPVSFARLLQRLRANLGNRRLIELGERRAERLMALYEISRAIGSTLDSGAILYTIARKIAESMELVRCSFIEPDLQNGVGHVIACKDDPNIASLEINLANYPEIIQVLRTGRRVVIDDVATDPIMAGIRKFADVFADQSIMTLPLEFHGEVVGVLQIRKKSRHKGFSAREIEDCEMLAATAASALKNAQLYEAIERHNQSLRQQKRELEQLSAELKSKNQELIELQRLKEEFSMMLVHDLRNPLMIVQGVLDLLRYRSRPDADERELIDDGTRNTRKILDLVDRLLEVAKLESGELRLTLEPVDAAAFVRESLEPYRAIARSRGIDLHAEIPGAPPAIVADRRGLGQVLDNLLANAFKFTPDGGRVAVRIEPAAEALRLVVEDSGAGIPAEDLPFVFKKFHQGRRSQRKGFGLGLTIVDLMVRAHGGSVRVESEEGKGSRFEVLLPLKPVTASALALPAVGSAVAREP